MHIFFILTIISLVLAVGLALYEQFYLKLDKPRYCLIPLIATPVFLIIDVILFSLGA